MKRSFFLIAFILLPLLTARAQTPPLPTIDQILEKYIAAIGGRAAVEKVTSLSAKGTIEITGVGLSGSVELWQKAPDKAATRTEMAGIGVQREGFDGTTAWSDDGQSGLRDRTGPELVEAKRTAIFPRELKMKSIYPTLTVKGRERVGTRDTYVVEGVPAEGTPARMFFDAESGLLVRQIITRLTTQGPLEVDVSFDDYRDVNGVKRAFTLKQDTAMFSAVIKFAEVKHNVAIDDATFSKPK